LSVIDDYQIAFAKLVGVPYARSFWKGRLALYAILRALQIGEGDEVILPGFTCVVVPNAIRLVGATPIFADIAPGTYNLDPDSVERNVTSRTRLLLLQHTFGIPAPIDRLADIAARHRLTIVEDCAHSLASTYRGQPLGTFGAAAFFSSQWSKPFTTGLGGIVVASDSRITEPLTKIHLQFQSPPRRQVIRLRFQYELYQRAFSPRLYWLAVRTLNELARWKIFVGSSNEEELHEAGPPESVDEWRMSTFQARVGLEQLRMFPRNSAHRRQLAALYRNHLQDHGWEVPAAPREADTVFLRYPIRVGNKWELLSKASHSAVEVGGWFESVLHPIRSTLDGFGYKSGVCAMAERTAREVINLPVHPKVSLDEAQRILDFFDRTATRPTS
jgi:dTDP-4-amino-4,6-dideoxygalactose transaminase